MSRSSAALPLKRDRTAQLVASAMGHELPRRWLVMMSAFPPRAAATVTDPRGSYGPITDKRKNATGVCFGLPFRHGPYRSSHFRISSVGSDLPAVLQAMAQETSGRAVRGQRHFDKAACVPEPRWP